MQVFVFPCCIVSPRPKRSCHHPVFRRSRFILQPQGQTPRLTAISNTLKQHLPTLPPPWTTTPWLQIENYTRTNFNETDNRSFRASNKMTSLRLVKAERLGHLVFSLRPNPNKPVSNLLPSNKDKTGLRCHHSLSICTPQIPTFNPKNRFFFKKSATDLMCLSVHRCICVEKKNQLDITECFIALKICSTCFGHFYAHHQELETICVLLPPMVYDALGAGCRGSGDIPLPGRITCCPAPDSRQPATKHWAPQAVITHIQSRAPDDGRRSARNMLSIL